jgi:hypothetical protein
MLIQRLFQTVVISTLVGFAVPALASSALPLCGEEKDQKAEKDQSKKSDDKDQTAEEEKKDDKKRAKKDDSDAPA